AVLTVGDPAFAVPVVKRPPAPKLGVMISFVHPDGTAGRAGLREGDVILTFATKKLERATDLVAALKLPGKRTLTYWRDGRQTSATLAAGLLGIGVDPRSAPEAVRAWREREDLLRPSSQHYAPLPGTRFEVEAIKRLVGPSKVTTLLGSAASEQA